MKKTRGYLLSNLIKRMNFTVSRSVLDWQEKEIMLTCPDKVNKILVEGIGIRIFGVSSGL